MNGTVILSGVVGSTAYGLATPESDVDRIGIYAAPTVAFHGLHPPLGREASHVSIKPDATYHEAGKYVALALKANPTVTELVWLGSYETRTPLGDELIGIRSALLCGPAVRNAYLGYATQQFRRLENRGDGSFSSDTRKRTSKHARHLWRLLHQGTVLHLTGELIVRLTEDEARECREFGERVSAGLESARGALTSAEMAFDRPGVLPSHPDTSAAEAWLQGVRAAFYDREASHATAPVSSLNSPAS